MNNDNNDVAGLLGRIVLGPHHEASSLAWTIYQMRLATKLLEYRYAEDRRAEAAHAAYNAGVADNGQQGQGLAPAKPKRNRGRPAKTANGQAPHEPAAPAGEPLFQTAENALTQP